MSSEREIKERLLGIVPIGSLHMYEFLKLMDIKFDSEITKTACVTCASRPVLYLNKEFVETHCKTDEHLFMLVMHELYHIILGHTRLYDGGSIVENIAFDAIINSILCKTFKDRKYTSFFEKLNSDESFPGCLLRPMGEKTPKEYKPILHNLYDTDSGTYYEVFKVLLNDIDKLGVNFIIIGSHDETGMNKNPLIKKLLDKAIAKWPIEMIDRMERGMSGNPDEKQINLLNAKKERIQKMNKLLKKAGMLSNINALSNRVHVENVYEDASTFIPNYKDRTSVAKKSLYGSDVIIYNTQLSNRKLVRDRKLNTLIYLDVSGSVDAELKEMIPLLLYPYKNGECKLYVFSTKVYETKYKDFKNCKYKTTGGTDVNCIFEHYSKLNEKDKAKKILILTDGYIGDLDKKYKEMLKDNHIKVYFGLFSRHTRNDIKDYAEYIEKFDF